MACGHALIRLEPHGRKRCACTHALALGPRQLYIALALDYVYAHTPIVLFIGIIEIEIVAINGHN